jgi:MoxR-like ATPase
MERISNEKLKTLSFEERYKLLSKVEKKYFNIMKTKSGVLYITSRPGLAKSSIAREIARIMGYNYFDIRLSTADETDFGMPKLKERGVTF